MRGSDSFHQYAKRVNAKKNSEASLTFKIMGISFLCIFDFLKSRSYQNFHLHCFISYKLTCMFIQRVLCVTI